MNGALQKLLSISSAPISRGVAKPKSEMFERYKVAGLELSEMLKLKNGFYAFESALHVLPVEDERGALGIAKWNEDKLWRCHYGDLAEGYLFFAEDVFGNQFCINDHPAIGIFDAETGGFEVLAGSVGEFVEKILENYDNLTGYTLAHDWQCENGALPLGKRLMPKIPFVLNGEFKTSNLYAIDGVSSMRNRGSLARQIKDLPDGSQIKVQIVE